MRQFREEREREEDAETVWETEESGEDSDNERLAVKVQQMSLAEAKAELESAIAAMSKKRRAGKVQKRWPSPSALIVSTNQRLPDRWRVKTMKRFGSSVTLHRAGAARRARTAFDGPAACALVARVTKATSDLCARVIVASAVAQNAR